MSASRSEPVVLAMVPWFHRRPWLTVTVAAALFAGVFVLRIFEGTGPESAVNMLYVLPICLLAVAFGQRVGLVAGLGAIALVVAWVLVRDVDLGVVGWASRVLPLLLVGYLLGRAADGLHRAEVARRRLELAAQRHREAIEINDTLVQGMAAAKWSLEMGRVETGLVGLNETLELGHQMVSELMRQTDMGPDGGRAPLSRSEAPRPRNETADR